MTCCLSNKYTKNYCDRTILVQVIADDVVPCFFFETRCISTANNFNALYNSCIVGANSTRSSAYMRAPRGWPNIEHPCLLSLISISSTYTINNMGESIPPCLTPHVTLKKDETTLFHLTQITTLSYQLSTMHDSSDVIM